MENERCPIWWPVLKTRLDRFDGQTSRIYYLGSDPAVGGLHLHDDSFVVHWGGHLGQIFQVLH
jgi:hypothetical protein